MKTRARRTAPPVMAADDFRLEEFLPYRLSVAANRVARVLARRSSQQFGLSIPEWRVLATVGRFGIASPGAVCERTAMDKVKVSRAAASLVSRGLLKQTQDPNDGRGRRLQLTRKGMAAHSGMVPLARELEAALLEDIGRVEWAALNRALLRINEHARWVDAPGPDGSPD